jgi:tetratricopeptide (TPR) repeat protein
MILRRVFFPFAMAIAVCTSPPRSVAQAEDLEIKKLRLEAQEAETTGDLMKAFNLFEEVQIGAANLGRRDAEANAAWRRAHLIESLARVGEERFRLSKAEELYQYAISVGTPEQQLIAQNDLGVLLLKEKRYGEALELFLRLDYSRVSPSERFPYDYNFGRALEANGRFDEAYEKYGAAVKEQPRFNTAVDGAFRMLHEGKVSLPPSKKIVEASRLAAILLASNETEVAARQLRKSLTVWSSESEATGLLAPLLRYYVLAQINPDQFKREEWEFLSQLRTDSLREAINEINLAYTGTFQPTFEPSQQVFRAFSSSKDFSQLLKTIGDFFCQQNDARKAVERYSLAAAIDTTNIEASLYAAAVLRAHREIVDPKGTLLEELIDKFFEEKGKSYYEVRVDPHNWKAWKNILRLHMLLGTIFEREGKWRGTGSEDPRGAVFQWSHAARAEQILLAGNPDEPPAPGLHLSLANAYRHINKPKKDIWQEYITAAEGFTKTLRRSDASAALQQANDLKTQLNSHDRERLQMLQATIKELPAD